MDYYKQSYTYQCHLLHVIVPYTATPVYQGSFFQELLKDWNISPIAIPN